jgi:hypothetical protein
MLNAEPAKPIAQRCQRDETVKNAKKSTQKCLTVGKLGKRLLA